MERQFLTSWTATKGSVELVEWLIRHGSLVLVQSFISNHYWTPLRYACHRMANLDVLATLLNNSALINSQTNTSRTALFVHIHRGARKLPNS